MIGGYWPAACVVCFGNPDAPMAKAAMVGVLFLMVVIAVVLGGIGLVALVWARRARALSKKDESADVRRLHS